MRAFDKPRAGLCGLWDRLAGPGATPAENLLNVAWTAAFTAFAAVYALAQPVGWSPLQWVLVIAFAVDLAGGITVNASPAARRWWRRPGQGAGAPLLFSVAHLHPFLVAFSFPEFGWRAAAELYAFTVAATGLTLLVPHRLRRPASHAFFAVALMLCMLHWPLLTGIAWFGPLYTLKLLLAHLLDDGASLSDGPRA
jgi:hypothetical protein